MSTKTMTIDPLDDLIQHLMTGSPRQYVYPADANSQPPKPWLLTKVCNKCGEEQSLDSFRANKDGKSGHRNTCKSCMSVKKPKVVNYAQFDQRRWLQEATLACPCVVCDEAPILPESVIEAREHLLSNAPVCSAHKGTQSLKARLAQRNWKHTATEKLATIDAWYDLTMTLLKAPKLKNDIGKAAFKWLDGERFTPDGDSSVLHSRLATELADCYESTAPDELKKGLSKKMNYQSWHRVYDNEVQMAELIGDDSIEVNQFWDLVMYGTQD